MEENKKFREANLQLLETWSDFVKVSLANGETIEGLRKRLGSNNLTEEQINIILDPKSRDIYLHEQGERNGRYWMFGFLKLFAALFFLGAAGTINMITSLIMSVCFFVGSIISFSKVRKIYR